jgi:hypothetical protein
MLVSRICVRKTQPVRDSFSYPALVTASVTESGRHRRPSE